MDNLTLNNRKIQKSNSLKTKSKILNTYYKLSKLRQDKTDLCFPNSLSNLNKLSTKSVYRPITDNDKVSRKKKLKSMEKKKSITSIKICYPEDIKNTYKKKSASSSSSFSENHDNEKQIKLLNYEIDNQPYDIKYSWQDFENWISPSEKNKKLNNKKSQLEIKYSWQIIGMSAQTSETLINNYDINNKKPECKIKYSWQIIGTETQASMSNFSSLEESNYWDGKILTSSCKKNSLYSDNNNHDNFKNNNYRILYNESIQTSADKILQTELTDCRVKYSWQNLTKPYLHSDENI